MSLRLPALQEGNPCGISIPNAGPRHRSRGRWYETLRLQENGRATQNATACILLFILPRDYVASKAECARPPLRACLNPSTPFFFCFGTFLSYHPRYRRSGCRCPSPDGQPWNAPPEGLVYGIYIHAYPDAWPSVDRTYLCPRMYTQPHRRGKMRLCRYVYQTSHHVGLGLQPELSHC